MALIIWNENLSVKIKSIDDQHKKLIDMINDFYDNIANRSNKENISKLIKSMKDYTVTHFKLEEEYMRRFDYPEYKSHKAEHDSFIAKVTEVEEKYNSGKLVLSLEMTTFLKDWLKKHIMGIDKKYSDFFISNGVK